MTDTVLILGGSGLFGRNATRAFRQAGWQVRQFDRAADDLVSAARGADVIVNAWNPPNYNWTQKVSALHARVIDAARRSGSTVIVPGNVYVFGKDAPRRFGETTPHRAENSLGRIRREMEAAYRAAGVQTIILRGGDFLDVEPSGSWFDQILTAKMAKGVFTYPGRSDVPHAWAYLPDMTRAAVLLAEKRAHLRQFEDVPFPGFTLTGQELAQIARKVSGQNLRLKRMSWLPIFLVAPFWKMARGLLEMRYLWNKPHMLDDEKFNGLLPDFQATPLDDAMFNALEHKINPDQAVARGLAYSVT